MGRLAKTLAYLSFCDLIPAAGELRLDEVEPDIWFLLIVGAKLDLSGSWRCDGLTIVTFRHAFRKFKSGVSPSNGRELFPRRMKKQRSHCEMESKKKIAPKKQSKPTGWSAVLTVFVSSKFYCLFVDFKVKSMQKKV